MPKSNRAGFEERKTPLSDPADAQSVERIPIQARFQPRDVGDIDPANTSAGAHSTAGSPASSLVDLTDAVPESEAIAMDGNLNGISGVEPTEAPIVAVAADLPTAEDKAPDKYTGGDDTVDNNDNSPCCQCDSEPGSPNNGPLSGSSLLIYHSNTAEITAFASMLADYNSRAPPAHRINHLYLSGGSINFQTQTTKWVLPESFSTYKTTVPNVNSMHLIVDASATGIGSVPSGKLVEMASGLGKSVCQDKRVAGVFLDIEPYRSNPTAINQFASTLASTLAACGKVMTFFVSAYDVTPQLITALGPNAVVYISGYDLDQNSPPPSKYASDLRINIAHFRKTFPSAKFIMGIPAGGSYLENTYTLGDTATVGAAASGRGQGATKKMSRYTTFSGGEGYVVEAVRVCKEVQKETDRFLGIGMFKMSADSVYGPKHIFELDGEKEWLMQNL
ncbi:hypothetical protein HK102_007838 [Quaeritorhiza haematococci]|nr:hypothetical protein HK102_007838 [Quaeritorhiza haematococci]